MFLGGLPGETPLLKISFSNFGTNQRCDMADQDVYDLLKEIELNELVLPEFQREFIWTRIRCES